MKRIRVLSFADFAKRFGGLSAVLGNELRGPAVFPDGGSQAWIVRIAKKSRCRIGHRGLKNARGSL